LRTHELVEEDRPCDEFNISHEEKDSPFSVLTTAAAQGAFTNTGSQGSIEYVAR
jgi:hypothetical protein